METHHHQFFTRHTTKILLPTSFNLITVNHSDTVGQVLKVFKEHNISSAPVIEKPVISDPEHPAENYSGIIDIVDLVTFAVEIFSNLETLSEEELRQLQDQWKRAPISDIVDISGRSPLVPIHAGSPLLYCLGALSRPSVHRVPVTDHQGHIIGVVTQSHVISFLHENISCFSEAMRKFPVRRWMPPRPVIYVRSNTIVLEAFQKLCKCMVTGLAVLNEQDKLIGNISASDLKKVDQDNIVQTMQLPIQQFLSLYPWSKAITVTLEDTLESVLETLVRNKIHRVYVEHNEKALGVISLCDIIHFISRPF
jgi:CBS domain-containing protein